MTEDTRPRYVFKRTASYERGWGRKYILREWVSLADARQICANFNRYRSPGQIRRNTKAEFDLQENR